MDLPVLYEDNHLIAVVKPAGLLTQGDITGDISLIDEVKSYLKEKYRKPGNVFLGLVHRLDRPVSGIVLFAKTSKGASRLSEQFRNQSVEKTYQAIVIGKPNPGRGVLVNYLSKDRADNKVEVYDRPRPGSNRAELAYETIKGNNKYSLVKVQLKTGRSHQIRAQLAQIGCPVLGDVKYGAPVAFSDKSLCLCATGLSFVTATEKKKVVLSVAAPKDWGEYVR